MTPTPTPSASPTPTAKETAATRLAEIIPWVVNPPDSYHFEAKARLTEIWLLDADLGDAVARLPWLEDGVDSVESFVTRDMASLATADTDTARMAASLAWLANEPTPWKRQAIGALANIAHTDPQIAKLIVGLPWFSDDITVSEEQALRGLTRISSTDLELAKRIISSSRFVDDLNLSEVRALHALGEIALRDHRLASLWGEYAIIASEDSGLDAIRDFLYTMDLLVIDWQEDALDKLTEQRWFADGLDNEEVSLISVLRHIYDSGLDTLYNDLIQTPFIRSATVSLPLAGEVNLWVFQPTPFPPGEDLPAMLEESVRIMEEFMGEPFPVTDVILVLINRAEAETDYGVGPFGGGGHFGDFMVLTRYGPVPHNWKGLYHETAHYYFQDRLPQWLIEGGANFMQAYVNDRVGLLSLEDQRPEAWRRAQYNCLMDGLSNIQELNTSQADKPFPPHPCDYILGEHFLLSLYEALGEEATSTALRELYLLSKSKSSTQAVTEKEIYQAFLRNTPSGMEEELLALYRQFHTPDFAPEEAETPSSA